MIQNRKKVMALFLCLVMCLSLFPATALADAEIMEEPVAEELIIEEPVVEEPVVEEPVVEEPVVEEPVVEEPVVEEPAVEEPVVEEPAEDPTEPAVLDEGEEAPVEVPDEEEDEEPSEEPVRVVFVCDPEDLTLTVYTLDENGDKRSFEPEEDGSYLLLPGEYFYDAECEGFIPIIQEPLEINEEEKTADVFLLKINNADQTEHVNDIAANANTYVINGVSVSHNSVTTGQYNCWIYAKDMYNLIWGSLSGYSNDRTQTSNLLHNITSKQDLTLTVEHLQAYVSEAALGSVLRTTNEGCLFIQSDDVGHSQIIVQKDSNGFTVFESNINLGNGQTGSREKYYTWSNYVSQWNDENHKYIKYIKWPGTHSYTSANYGTPLTSGAGRTIPDGDYLIAAAADTSYYLNIEGTELPAASGTNVSLGGPLEGAPWAFDIWTVTYVDEGGFYSIKQMGADISLDVSGGSRAEGANIQVYTDIGSDAQRWSISENSDNSYRIQAKCSGYSVDYINLSSGKSVHQWSTISGDAQKWTFIPYNANSSNLGTRISFHTQGGELESAAHSRAYDGVNTTRKNGQLIVYNWPNQSIDTNSYGIELVVDSTGRITDIRRYGDENRRTVPANGFILSGHVAEPSNDNDGFHFLAGATDGQYAGVDFAEHLVYIFDSYSAYISNFKYVKAGALYGDLPEPTREGYVFDGWYSAPNGGNRIDSNTTYYTSDLYAHWGNEEYTVTYNANGGTGAPASQTKTHNVALTLSGTKPTRANVSAGSYTVTLNANGGSVSTSSLSAARTTSYSFKNWNTAANGSGTSYNPGASYTANADVTLYAQWNSSTTTAAVTLPTPTRSGYSFQGWATSSSASSGVTGSYTPSGNVTLYAIWKAGTYTVTYNANGGTGAPASQTKTHNVALTLSGTKPTRANASAGAYTVTLNATGGSVSTSSLSAARTTSYSFKNWNTAQNGSGTSFDPGASYTANADVTLYAQWNSSTTTAAVTLPTPTRSGYSFQGWATSSSASSGVTGSYTPAGNVTLYAIWKEEGTTSGTLSLGSVRGAPGSEVTLELTLDKNPGIMMLSFRLSYDKNKLQYLGGEDGSLTGWSFSTTGDGVLWDGDNDTTATGTIVKLRFKILESAAEGETAITLNALEAWNYNEEGISFGTSAGKVTISKRIPGDTTGDGKVNGLDLIRLRKYLAGDDVQIDLSNADVTGDGKVNGLDLIRLRKYLAGDNVVLN